MPSTPSIDNHIIASLPSLSLKQKEAVLELIGAFKVQKADEFELEINNRIAEYERGEAITYSFDEAITIARESYRAKKL